MIPTLKAEFCKLLTVRSTYVVTAIVVGLVAFIAFYAEGWRLNGLPLQDPTLLAGDVTGALNLTVFGAIVAILLMSHEYRYNTIMHTLTISRSRTAVLLSKAIVVSLYALVLAVLVGVLSPLLSDFGIHAHGYSLVHQTFDVWDLTWRSLFYSWGYGMAGLVIALLVRSQVAAISVLFLVPNIVEQLIGLVLKENTKYLPFTSLSLVIHNNTLSGATLAPTKAALVFTGYLIASCLVAWVLFIKRDAS